MHVQWVHSNTQWRRKMHGFWKSWMSLKLFEFSAIPIKQKCNTQITQVSILLSELKLAMLVWKEGKFTYLQRVTLLLQPSPTSTFDSFQKPLRMFWTFFNHSLLASIYRICFVGSRTICSCLSFVACQKYDEKL